MFQCLHLYNGELIFHRQTGKIDEEYPRYSVLNTNHELKTNPATLDSSELQLHQLSCTKPLTQLIPGKVSTGLAAHSINCDCSNSLKSLCPDHHASLNTIRGLTLQYGTNVARQKQNVITRLHKIKGKHSPGGMYSVLHP